MATERFWFEGTAGTNHYLAVFALSGADVGKVFDFSDNTFKALSAPPTTPYISATEYADLGGADSGYSADVDLSLLNSTGTAVRFGVSWFTNSALTSGRVSTALEIVVISSALVDPLVPTAAQNADAVWDEALSGHLTAGTAGAYLAAFSLSGIADAVWDEALSGHVTAGTAGASLGSGVTCTELTSLPGA